MIESLYTEAPLTHNNKSICFSLWHCDLLWILTLSEEAEHNLFGFFLCYLNRCYLKWRQNMLNKHMITKLTGSSHNRHHRQFTNRYHKQDFFCSAEDLWQLSTDYSYKLPKILLYRWSCTSDHTLHTFVCSKATYLIFITQFEISGIFVSDRLPCWCSNLLQEARAEWSTKGFYTKLWMERNHQKKPTKNNKLTKLQLFSMKMKDGNSFQHLSSMFSYFSATLYCD